MPGEADTMVRMKFSPAGRRQALAARLMELRLLIPQLEEERWRIEGQIMLLDEISEAPQGTGLSQKPGGD